MPPLAQRSRETSGLQEMVNYAADRLALLRLKNLRESLADVEEILSSLKGELEVRRQDGRSIKLTEQLVWEAEQERARLLGQISAAVDVPGIYRERRRLSQVEDSFERVVEPRTRITQHFSKFYRSSEELTREDYEPVSTRAPLFRDEDFEDDAPYYYTRSAEMDQPSEQAASPFELSSGGKTVRESKAPRSAETPSWMSVRVERRTRTRQPASELRLTGDAPKAPPSRRPKPQPFSLTGGEAPPRTKAAPRPKPEPAAPLAWLARAAERPTARATVFEPQEMTAEDLPAIPEDDELLLQGDDLLDLELTEEDFDLSDLDVGDLGLDDLGDLDYDHLDLESDDDLLELEGLDSELLLGEDEAELVDEELGDPFLDDLDLDLEDDLALAPAVVEAEYDLAADVDDLAELEPLAEDDYVPLAPDELEEFDSSDFEVELSEEELDLGELADVDLDNLDFDALELDELELLEPEVPLTELVIEEPLEVGLADEAPPLEVHLEEGVEIVQPGDSGVADWLDTEELVAIEEPVAVEAPVEIEEPVAVEAPVEIEEPVAVEAPVEIEEPVAVEAPVEIEEPVAVEAPVEIEEPIAVDAPVEIEESFAVEAPIETEESIAVEAPVEIEEPVAVEAPVEIEEPVAVEAPVELEEPVAVEAPVEVEESVAVESPVELEEPVAVEAPVEVEELVAVEAPVEVEEPVAVEAPIEIEEPVAVEAPVGVEEPIAVEAPVEIEEPIAVEAPAEIEEPVAVEAPAEIEEPVAVEAPVEIEEPTAVEAPVEIEEPIAVEAPVELEEPIAVEAQVEIEEPKAVEAPVEIEEPVAVEAPVEIEEPTAVEAPVEVEEPIATEAPVELDETSVELAGPDLLDGPPEPVTETVFESPVTEIVSRDLSGPADLFEGQAVVSGEDDFFGSSEPLDSPVASGEDLLVGSGESLELGGDFFAEGGSPTTSWLDDPVAEITAAPISPVEEVVPAADTSLEAAIEEVAAEEAVAPPPAALEAPVAPSVESGASAQERRRLVRLSCSYDTSAYLEGRPVNVKLVDISLGGGKLLGPASNFQRGQLIQVSNPLPEARVNEPVTARIVWMRPSREEEGRFDIGLQFEESPEVLGKSWVITVLNKIGMQSKVFNQRKYTRAAANLPIEIDLKTKERTPGTAIDIGLGGALLAVDRPLSPTTRFTLHMGPLGHHEKLELNCEVINSRHDEGGVGWTHSAKFSEISTTQTKLLGKYVVDLLKTGGSV